MTITQYDIINVHRFRLGEHNKYLCSMCGQDTTLGDSVSHQGFNLVCNHCYYKIMAITGDITLLKDIHSVGKEKESEYRGG